MKWLPLAALAAVLAACGDGSDAPVGSPGVGDLVISITGLPAGVDADVVISGGSLNRNLVSSQTIRGVPIGVYSLAASSVLTGSTVYAPQATNQQVSITAGAGASATVAYQNAGALRLGLQAIANVADAPLFLTAPAGDSRLFIAERAGRVRIIRNGIVEPTPVIDISSRVSTVGEGGLLSLGFDPGFAQNGFLFLHFTDPTGDVAIERFHLSIGSPDVADPVALRILTIPHRSFSNHKGGRLAFGPDGFLYLSVGDGGGGGDPLGSGQNLNTLLGKLLRIDVANGSIAQPYAIPPLNPFVGQANRRPEIWAYGLRNPWRYAFDAPSGLLYIGDVGQGRREEVDVAPLAAGGLNYGWNITEGSLCYPTDPCSQQGITLPVLEYDHDASGGCAISGGFVYRGRAIPELRGRYFYSDLCSGWLRSFRYSDAQGTERVDWNIANVGQIYSFGEDAQGELYMLATSNIIYKIVRQ